MMTEQKKDIFPCVRCLNKAYRKIVRKPANHIYYIIQCLTCGFNSTSDLSMEAALHNWNSFEVWKLVDKERLDVICAK